ncbi:ribonuclease H-like protein [Cubamyces sp. BRFM 1775]|nr:ribonuclease H-like protein [Cubamyces sp. BRFM 1775]
MVSRVGPPDSEVSFYAVAKGRIPGIYCDWADCKAQVLNYYGAKYKKCASPHAAKSWLEIAVDCAAANEAFDAFLARNPEYLGVSSFNTENLSAASVSWPKSSASASSYSHIAMPRPTASLSRPSDAAVLAQMVATPDRPATPADPVALAEGATLMETKQATAQVIQEHTEDDEPLIVYSDGACKGNGQPGSIAGIGVWWGPDHLWNLSERCPGGQTNNRAELIAIIRVLETAPMDARELIIKTDSHYSMCCLEKWLDNWKRNGWKKANGGAVNNVELIKYADIMLQERRNIAKQQVKFVKVKGHSGDVGNDGADRLAVAGTALPEMPERDWEDLIAQVQARMSMPTYSRGIAESCNIPKATSSPPSIASPNPPSVSRDANSRVAAPSTLPGRPLESMSPSSRSETQEATSSRSDPRLQAPHSGPKEDIPPQELELYAACVLDDDDFLREVEALGVY